MKADRQTLEQTVLTLLRAIAPEFEPGEIEPARPLRQQVDLDSMDWLNFLVRLHERFGVSIPESDYGRLASLKDLVDYLQDRLG